MQFFVLSGCSRVNVLLYLQDVLNMEINSFPKSTVKAYRALHSCKFTKEMLNTVKVSNCQGKLNNLKRLVIVK